MLNVFGGAVVMLLGAPVTRKCVVVGPATLPTLTLELVPVTSANRIAYLQTRKADLVISTLGKNPEREKVIDFSAAYSPFFQAVFGPKSVAVKSV